MIETSSRDRAYVPMQGTINGIFNAVVVIVVIRWIVNIFGLYHYVSQFRVGT
jgi:type IV secretory pathway TrbD component